MPKYLNIDTVFERASLFKILHFLGFRMSRPGHAGTFAVYENSIGEKLLVFCKEGTEELLTIGGNGQAHDSIGLLLNYGLKNNLHDGGALELVQKVTALSNYSAEENPRLPPSNYDKVRTDWLRPAKIGTGAHKITLVTDKMLLIELDNKKYQAINLKETKNLIYFKTSHWSRTIFSKPFSFPLNEITSKSLFLLHSYNDCAHFNQTFRQRHDALLVKRLRPGTGGGMDKLPAYDRYSLPLNSTLMEQDSLAKYYVEFLNTLCSVINLSVPGFKHTLATDDRALRLGLPLLDKQSMKVLFLSINKAKKENREKLYRENRSTDKKNADPGSYEEPNQIKFDTASKALAFYLSFENVRATSESLIGALGLSMIKIRPYDLFDYKYANT